MTAASNGTATCPGTITWRDLNETTHCQLEAGHDGACRHYRAGITTMFDCARILRDEGAHEPWPH